MKPFEKHIMLAVADKHLENPEFATLFFDYSLEFIPGQFVMVWIPGVDEKPYTLSFVSDTRFGITIEAKGIFSKKAISLEKGARVGFRGPFGSGFSLPEPGKHVALVAGGCGMAPLAPLLDQIKDCQVTCIHGARTKSHLLFPDRFSVQRRFCTDDGSFGHQGRVTDLLVQEIKKGTPPDQVYACGPEIMMFKIFQLCEQHQIHCEVSLERYMRCGFGICGACVCGKQIVCKDGPVFGSETLRSMADFNTTALLKSGKPVSLTEYFSWRHP